MQILCPVFPIIQSNAATRDFRPSSSPPLTLFFAIEERAGREKPAPFLSSSPLSFLLFLGGYVLAEHPILETLEYEYNIEK